MKHFPFWERQCFWNPSSNSRVCIVCKIVLHLVLLYKVFSLTKIHQYSKTFRRVSGRTILILAKKLKYDLYTPRKTFQLNFVNVSYAQTLPFFQWKICIKNPEFLQDSHRIQSLNKFIFSVFIFWVKIWS